MLKSSTYTTTVACSSDLFLKIVIDVLFYKLGAEVIESENSYINFLRTHVIFDEKKLSYPKLCELPCGPKRVYLSSKSRMVIKPVVQLLVSNEKVSIHTTQRDPN